VKGRSAERPPNARPVRDSQVSIWIALAILVTLTPTLAHTPQNGDGAEIVNTALLGGVMHPPGFPLQAWLDRAVVRIPGVEPAWAIALLGLFAHACAAGLIAETLGLLGARPLARVLGAAAFALHPAIWAVSVEPEVFAPAHAALAAMIWIAVRVSRSPPERIQWRSALGVGLIGAACAASHPIAVAALPALAGATLASARRREGRVARALVLAAALLAPAAALYLSLPLLRTSSIWPDWGSLRTPADVLRHALRADYGAFSLSAASGASNLSGLSVLFDRAWSSWLVAVAFLAAGAVVLLRRADWSAARLPVFGTLAAGLALLAAARLPEQTYAAAVLARLEGPAVIAGALLAGLGCDAFLSRLRARSTRGLVTTAVALTIAYWLIAGWREADVSHDTTLALHARGIAAELPDRAVYVTEGDVETFLGIPAPSGTRFPISGPEIAPEWYWRDVVPRLEPRVLQPGVPVNQWSDFLVACFARGLPVASTSSTLIESSRATPELRGLIFVARADADSELTAESIAAAARLAPIAEALPRLPARGHAFSRFYVRRFARAYAGAAEALRRFGDPALAGCADSIADALNHGADLAARNALLRSFEVRCTRR